MVRNQKQECGIREAAKLERLEAIRCAARDLERVRYRWGVLFQNGALFSALSVFDNIALPLRELGSVPPDLVKPLVLLKLAQVGLKPEDALKRPAELSGGQKQRIAILRALVACGWFGIQAWIGGDAIYHIIAIFVPSWRAMPTSLAKTSEMISARARRPCRC